MLLQHYQVKRKRTKKQGVSSCGHFNLDLRCLQCRKLYEKWNKKLGFQDLEKLLVKKDKTGKPVNAQLILKKDAVDDAFRDLPTAEVTRKFDYYHSMSTYAQQEKFDDEADRIVMQMRGEGTPIKDICAALKKQGHKHHRQTVRFIIRKFEYRWGLKQWKPNQLTSKR